jgi:C4-dicarboxylate-specific signal transduction histidine kinase
VLGGGERIIEVRSNAMPDKGIVATFTDITQRVAADRALKQANETLEQRVAERTAELTRVNHELGEARASPTRPISARRASSPPPATISCSR